MNEDCKGELTCRGVRIGTKKGTKGRENEKEQEKNEREGKLVVCRIWCIHDRIAAEHGRRESPQMKASMSTRKSRN